MARRQNTFDALTLAAIPVCVQDFGRGDASVVVSGDYARQHVVEAFSLAFCQDRHQDLVMLISDVRGPHGCVSASACNKSI